MVPALCEKREAHGKESCQSDVMSDSLFTFLNDLSNRMLSSHKKVVLTIKQYKIKDIYPNHPSQEQDPTHILIFCLRWVKIKKFQPIGGILFKPEEYNGSVTDLGKTLGELIKAYLWSIKKLDLNVVAIVSPPDDYFKIIIRYLTQSDDFETGESPITFYSEQFNDVACIYDPTQIQRNFEEIFKLNSVSLYHRGRNHCANWHQINQLLLKDNKYKTLRNSLFSNEDQISIFKDEVQHDLMNAVDDGTIDKEAYNSVILIKYIRRFLLYMEKESINTMKMDDIFVNWQMAIDTLENLKFKPISYSISDFTQLINFLHSLSFTEGPKLMEQPGIKDMKPKLLRKGKENKDCGSNRNKKPYLRPVDGSDLKKQQKGCEATSFNQKLYPRNSLSTDQESEDEKVLTPPASKNHKKSRNKNAPYLRPGQEKKLHMHQPLLKQVPKESVETDSDNVLDTLAKDTLEKVKNWSDSDDNLTSNCSSLEDKNDECQRLLDNPKTPLKPYSRTDSSKAKSSYGVMNLAANNLDASLKEYSKLVTQITKESSKNHSPDEKLIKNTKSDVEDKYEPHMCTFEYTSCIRSMKFAIKKLAKYNMDYFQIDAFKCDHIDYFVNLIKKEINKLQVPAQAMKDPDCTLQHQDQAYSVLEKGSGNLFCLNQAA